MKKRLVMSLVGLMVIGLFGRIGFALNGAKLALNGQEKIRHQEILTTPRTAPRIEETLKDILKAIVNPKSRFKIDVWVDKGKGARYYVGERLTVYFKSNRDCYLTLFDFTPAGEVWQLFPDYWHQDNFIKAGNIYQIPAPGDNFVFTVTGSPGEEIIKAIATTIPKFVPLSFGYKKTFPFPFSKNGKEFAFGLKLLIGPIPFTQWAEDSCHFYVAKQPLLGEIRVRSDPTFAGVYLDGKYQGRTSKTIYRVTRGYHTVDVRKIGYSEWSKTVYVGEGETVEIFAKLKKPYGSIYVISTPSYARVFLDGIEKGRTPLTIKEVEIGWHEIVLIKEYYCVYVERIYIGEEPVDEIVTLKSVRRWQ